MRTIVWVHGFPLSPEVFEDQRAITGVQHLIPALPGFGGTAVTGEPSIDDYARHVIAELDELGLEKATLAGVSMGGYVCLAVMRLAPERVEGLILIDTKETADDEKARQGRFASIGKVRAGGTAPVVEAMLPKMLTPDAPEELVQRVRSIMESASYDGVIDALRAMANRPDSSVLLPSIAVPVLIITGASDLLIPPSESERMAAAIPGARLIQIPGAAHLPNLEQPAAFNAAVEAWMEETGENEPR